MTHAVANESPHHERCRNGVSVDGPELELQFIPEREPIPETVSWSRRSQSELARFRGSSHVGRGRTGVFVVGFDRVLCGRHVPKELPSIVKVICVCCHFLSSAALGHQTPRIGQHK